jgi:hypothetical protein
LQTQPAQASQPAQTVQQPLTQQATQTPPASAPVAQASTDSALPTRVTPDTRPLNCTTKMHLKDGTILWQDFCTLEQAVLKQGSGGGSTTQQATTPAPPVTPQPLSKPQQAPSQLARNR